MLDINVSIHEYGIVRALPLFSLLQCLIIITIIIEYFTHRGSGCVRVETMLDELRKKVITSLREDLQRLLGNEVSGRSTRKVDREIIVYASEILARQTRLRNKAKGKALVGSSLKEELIFKHEVKMFLMWVRT